jgi:TolA-binding protein
VEASTREQVTSGQVFAQANRLRREGRLSQAIAGYTDLQKRFPGSVEALTAEIGLGVLRLQSGSADIALHHFQRYLQRSPTGELAPEALWGQSQALTVLARQDAAKRSYNTLLSQYPDSAYASAARAKLRTLQ